MPDGDAEQCAGTYINRPAPLQISVELYPIALLPVDESEELISRLRALPHSTEHAARSRGRTGLLHAAHDHAHVRRLHDDGDTLGFEHFAESEGDLLRQTLLYLQASAEHLGNASELGKADDSPGWDISDVHLQ